MFMHVRSNIIGKHALIVKKYSFVLTKIQVFSLTFDNNVHTSLQEETKPFLYTPHSLEIQYHDIQKGLL